MYTLSHFICFYFITVDDYLIKKNGSHTPGKSAGQLTGITHVQPERQSKTVDLITKQVKVFFTNEPSCIDELKVQYLKNRANGKRKCNLFYRCLCKTYFIRVTERQSFAEKCIGIEFCLAWNLFFS